jgi:hypothetical protein
MTPSTAPEPPADGPPPGQPYYAPAPVGRKSRKGRWAVLGGLVLFLMIGIATQFTPASGAPPVVSPRAVISAWSTGGGQDHTSAISKDLANVGAAAAATDIIGVSTACTSLQTHAEAAQAYVSIPDTQAQINWATALAHAARAATDCIAFTRNHDPDLLIQSGHELEAYAAAIGKLSDRANALEG